MKLNPPFHKAPSRPVLWAFEALIISLFRFHSSLFSRRS